MPYVFEPTVKVESKECAGVVFHVRRMTDGRKTALKKQLRETNSKLREIIRAQTKLDAVISGDDKEASDEAQLKWIELQEEFDGLMESVVKPETIRWGIHAIEGLVTPQGTPLTMDDISSWPSVLVKEAMIFVNAEMELDGAERKNLLPPTTSGEQAPNQSRLSIVKHASEEAGGGISLVGISQTTS